METLRHLEKKDTSDISIFNYNSNFKDNEKLMSDIYIVLLNHFALIIKDALMGRHWNNVRNSLGKNG